MGKYKHRYEEEDTASLVDDIIEQLRWEDTFYWCDEDGCAYMIINDELYGYSEFSLMMSSPIESEKEIFEKNYRVVWKEFSDFDFIEQDGEEILIKDEITEYDLLGKNELTALYNSLVGGRKSGSDLEE